MLVNFLQIWIRILGGMEAEVSDDMEIDDQELIIIPVKARDKGKKLLKANSTNAGVTMIQINNSKHSDAVVCEICSLTVTSKQQNVVFPKIALRSC